MTNRPGDPVLPGTRIDLPLPPCLAETFGYHGPARYLGLSWSPAGDELVLDDGRSSGSGQSWAFLVFRRHRAVAPLLEEWNLGYSDADAEHCLVLDRTANRASIAPLAQVRAFLRDQHPPVPPLPPEQAEELRQRIKQRLEQAMQKRPDPSEIHRSMQEQQGRIGRMMSFLDMCPDPPAQGRQG